MKAISLYQPWATLMAYEEKRFETRSWFSSYRGPILIHAAKRIESDQVAACRQPEFIEALKRIGIRTARELPLGQALAVGELVAVHKVEDIRAGLSAQERALGNYADGRFAWEFINVSRFKVPFKLRGHPYLWTVADNWLPGVE